MGVFFGWIGLSILVAIIASAKGRSGWGWFFISLLISPLLSLIVLLILGDSDEKREEKVRQTMDVIEKRKVEKEQAVGSKMTQEQAITELKKAKDLLDLQVITQEDYDKKKTELTPFLLPSNQGQPAASSNSDEDKKSPSIYDAYKYSGGMGAI